ncbi:MAG: SPFH domain-containing protein, partial [Lachnospiraceae bacterium]|nr:SPFH domain-containing protein [Lachnospiraceae bacterium]
TFGGEAPKDQRIYYFNTKEIMGNKYGTASPVPFRVVDERAAIDMDISVKCFGEYSYKIVNPLLFYKNVCNNITETYKRSNLESQLRSELLTALQPAFGKISEMGIRYSAVVSHTTELRDALKEELCEKWRDTRGIEIQEIGVSSIKATEEDEQMIKEMQRNVAFMDPSRAQAHLVGARASAMQAAASNTAGAAIGFMGMNMAAGAGSGFDQSLGQQVMMQQQHQYAQQTMQQAQQNAAQQNVAQQAAAGWTCSCGHTGNTGKFCAECGKKKPEEPAGWTCSCGSVNKGKFCPECGSKKPEGIPQYKCDKCGWEPPKGTKAPKFCPECGDPFDNGDII